MNWYDDPVFVGNPEDDHLQVSKIAKPAFRLSLQSSIHQFHPLDQVEAYTALFELFRPILERDAERLLFVEVAGKRARRRKSIKAEDWTPFANMRAAIDPDDRTFLGFDFQSGRNGDPDYERFDTGPTKFYCHVASNVRLDASIPVADFMSGALDIARLKECLMAMPVYSGLAGYGLCVSDTFDWPVSPHCLNLPARRYPALDCCVSIKRSWSTADEPGGYRYNEGRYFWLGGINWLTHVGEPFLSRLGGVEAITAGLDKRIGWETAPGVLLLQLGDRPITGQTGVDDDLLPLYFELGQRLQPPGDGCPSFQFPFQRPFDSGPLRERENVLWARRFYDRQWFDEFAEGRA